MQGSIQQLMGNVTAPAIAALLLACSSAEEVPHDPGEATTLSWVRPAAAERQILLDGEEIGRLRRDGDRWRLSAAPVTATLERSDAPLSAETPYPRRVVVEGRLGGSGEVLRDSFTLLAPPAPLSVEGLGLEVSTDTPGLNREEHAELREWLASQGLPADTRVFQTLHQADSGRELRVWYEISGRRAEGRLSRGGGGPWLARYDSRYRSEGGELKIHHKRTGEKGRFTYHRQSLELADSVESSVGELPALESHHCGCYGYAIGSDFMTLGDLLYHVEADWLDDRVGADFFIGFQRRESFPWIGLGDRRRMRDLARRVKAYRLTDARGEPFAEIALDLPPDPPSAGLGAVSYRVGVWGSNGERASLARIDHRGAEIQLRVFGERRRWPESLERLDALLAAMPTQVMRGDGIRDSHLAEVEQMIDWIRLIREPGEERLADLVSDVDALTAPGKVRALLGSDAERFHAGADALPPEPKRPTSLAAGTSSAENVERIGHLDIDGGGMVDVHDGVAYIGHMRPPFATSILDVSDPANPTILSRIEAKPHTHSHKARACGGVMLSNRELWAASIADYLVSSLFRKDLEIGLAVTDVSDPAHPRELALLPAGGIGIANAPAGVHRFELDCERKLAYVSATLEGYRGNIVLIVDLSDPRNPTEVGRWWAEGQWIAGGEKPAWSRNDHHVHHPNRLDDRLYVPLWYGGFSIVDISDLAAPRTVAHMEHRRSLPTHTALPVDHQLMGRRWLLVFDEDVSSECEEPQASMWLYDVSDETSPQIASSFQVAESGAYSRCDGKKGKRFGAHQPHEHVAMDNLVYAAWFAGGLRIVDISDPFRPEEVGHYVPEPVGGFEFPQTNDVFVDERGLIYLIDRNNGLDILRFSAGPTRALATPAPSRRR